MGVINYRHVFLLTLSIIIIVVSLIGLLISAKYPFPTLWYSTSVNYHAAADFCSVLFSRLLLLVFSVQGIFTGLILWAIASSTKNTKKNK